MEVAAWNCEIPYEDPYIMDFEPKKRELYEQVTEGGEFLSGSAEKLSTTKGSTNTQRVDLETYGSYFGFCGGSAKAGASWQQVDNTTKDTSRESRETQSHSTSFSQMYHQSGAVPDFASGPHTASPSEQTDANLINGERRLEGVQDVFLVIHMPKSLDGFCIQAGLDTGHLATVSTPQHLVFMEIKQVPDGLPEPNGGGHLPPPPPPPDSSVKQLVVTRRLVQSCGTFDENGNFHLHQVREPRPPIVVGEIAVHGLQTRALFRSAPAGGGEGRGLRVQVANNLNVVQSDINRAMLDTVSSTNYSPRKFEDSNVFKSLVASAIRSIDTPLTELVSKGYIGRETAERLARNKIRTASDLFSHTPVGIDMAGIQADRTEIIANLLGGKRK